MLRPCSGALQGGICRAKARCYTSSRIRVPLEAAQVGAQFGGVLVTHFTVFFERLADYFFQLGWQLRLQLSSGNWLTAQDRIENCIRGLSAKCLPPCSHFVEHCAEREEVRTHVKSFPTRLFRRHITGCADEHSWHGFRFDTLRPVVAYGCGYLLRAFRDAEIEDFY